MVNIFIDPHSGTGPFGEDLLIFNITTANGEPAGFGCELDFLACSESILAPTIGSDAAYLSVSGTSFATPLVTGVVCQIVEDAPSFL